MICQSTKDNGLEWMYYMSGLYVWYVKVLKIMDWTGCIICQSTKDNGLDWMYYMSKYSMILDMSKYVKIMDLDWMYYMSGLYVLYVKVLKIMDWTGCIICLDSMYYMSKY